MNSPRPYTPAHQALFDWFQGSRWTQDQQTRWLRQWYDVAHIRLLTEEQAQSALAWLQTHKAGT